LLELVRFAEDLGIDSVWVPDGFSDGHLETLTTMSAIATNTRHIEVGAYMLNASLRDSATLTRTVASLERLAPGRVRIMLGTGWDRNDYESLGKAFPSPDERTQQTKDTLEALKRETRAQLDVAGVLDNVLELAVAGADGWAVSADALDTYFERVSLLRHLCEEAGRPFGELRRSCTVPCVGDATERIADLAAHDMQEFRVVVNTDDRTHLEQLIEVIRAQEDGVSERSVKANGIEIWTQSFGEPAHPAILLIHGPATGLMWPDDLCEDLADGGRHVIRYDHRDTGRSQRFDFATEPYTMSDLAADAVGVLDAYGVRAAHVIGFSGGGMVAQTMAIEHPDRVSSLTSWGSTPLGASAMAGFQGAEASLPGPEQRVMDAFVLISQPAADEEEAVERSLGLGRAFTGTLDPFDEQEARQMMKRAVAHGQARGIATNIIMAQATAPDRTEMLRDVTAPTLVIHGTVDPAVPLPHGEATAEVIPGARLLTIEGMGHDFPPSAMTRIVSAILDHTGGA
jgi:pimeloyl-ACP methyl ester carboxylesterase